MPLLPQLNQAENRWFNFGRTIINSIVRLFFQPSQALQLPSFSATLRLPQYSHTTLLPALGGTIQLPAASFIIKPNL